MASVYLPDYIANANFHLQRFVPRLAAGTLKWGEVQQMTGRYRQSAICSLLLTGAPEQFFINMMQSAGAFLFFLERSSDEGKITSQAQPFYDALCGGYFEAAASIAAHSRTTWNQGYEYEEDFLYAYLQMRMLSLPQSADECRQLFDRFEVTAAPSDSPRVDVCRSLLTADSDAFNRAMPSVLTRRQERVEGMIKRGTLPEEVIAWFRPFAGECLALIRIAERLGLGTESHYINVPEESRPASPYRFDQDAWRHLDYAPAS